MIIKVKESYQHINTKNQSDDDIASINSKDNGDDADADDDDADDDDD